MKPTPDYGRYEFILVDKEPNGIATVTLNRPEKLNAVSADFHEELRDVWLDLGNDYEVDVIILTGAGRAFCAGGDVSNMGAADQPFGGGRSKDPLAVMGAEARRLVMNMLDVEQPVIAAVNGDAFGLGASLALLSDIIVVADDARIADTHVKVGLVAGDGGVVIWPLLIGPHRAKELLMRGNRLTGAEAFAMGMVNYSVARADVMTKARELAEELAAGAPLAIRWTKYAVNRWIKDVFQQTFDVGIALEMVSMRTADHEEGKASFHERRPPKFTGR
jgi:enoyl-CoA hydratase/carnithine racemase